MASKSSYPKPPGGIPPCNPERRRLLPIVDPTLADSKLLELPCPPRKSLIDERYSLSTHIVPAAFPRTTPDVAYPAGSEFSPTETREERTKRMSELKDEYCELQMNHWEGKLKGNSEKRLWICLNRYVRKDQGTISGRKKLTLFLAHANGFMKEIWEPVLRYLVSEATSDELLFDEIWAWDAANHGDSALLNRENLCALYDWSDSTRDILNFMINYLPDSFGDLPVHLPRLSPHLSRSRQQYGFNDRNLVSVGHSFGGNVTTMAAINCPALFSSLILVDPVIHRPPHTVPWSTMGITPVMGLVDAALQRRDEWPSKEEAMVLFKRNPFFSVWDPAVLDMYVEFGLYPDKNGRFKLKMPRMLEAAAFADLRASYEAWDLLPELDERVELKFIMPGKVEPALLRERQELTWLRPKNTSNVRIMSAGHLIPHEAPKVVAQEIHEFVQRKYRTTKPNL